MNQTPTTEKAVLDDKRKNAMLRYIGIMFVVAFLFVLLSMLSQLRTSEATISELNQSSTSALQKAENLQDTNRQLETDNAYLKGRIEELQKHVDDLELDLAVSQEKVQLQKEDLGELEARLAESEARMEQTALAYELLLQARQLASTGQDPAEALNELKNYEQYLGETALKEYKNLIKEGE